jgi:hypothetical protein
MFLPIPTLFLWQVGPISAAPLAPFFNKDKIETYLNESGGGGDNRRIQ